MGNLCKSNRGQSSFNPSDDSAFIAEVFCDKPIRVPLAEDKVPLPADLALPMQDIAKSPVEVYRKYTHDKHIELEQKCNFGNMLLSTFMLAYNKHLPIHLYPDDIWIAIVDIISKYINCDAEKFRTMLVDHDDKKELPIDVTNGVDWDKLVNQWAAMIQDDCKDKPLIGLLRSDFATTTDLDRIINAAFILDIHKEFYSLMMYALCGIPAVYLHGVEADWTKMLNKIDSICKIMANTKAANNLCAYLKKYIVPIIENFRMTYQSSKSKQYKEFWSQLLSHYKPFGSGSDIEWSGWVTALFPDVQCDPFTKDEIVIRIDTHLDSITNGKTKVPITFDNNGITINYILNAGFQHVYQNADGSVQVVKGYMVRTETQAELRQKARETREKAFDAFGQKLYRRGIVPASRFKYYGTPIYQYLERLEHRFVDTEEFIDTVKRELAELGYVGPDDISEYRQMLGKTRSSDAYSRKDCEYIINNYNVEVVRRD